MSKRKPTNETNIQKAKRIAKLVDELRKYDDRECGVPVVEEAADTIEELLGDITNLEHNFMFRVGKAKRRIRKALGEL